MTDAEADREILGLASSKRKFAIEVGMPLSEPAAQALERGIDNDWFRLVDVSTNVAAAPGRLMRVFRLTPAGMIRLTQVAKLEGVGHG